MPPARHPTGPPPSCAPSCFRIEMPPPPGRVRSTRQADPITEHDQHESTLPTRSGGGHLTTPPDRVRVGPRIGFRSTAGSTRRSRPAATPARRPSTVRGVR